MQRSYTARLIGASIWLNEARGGHKGWTLCAEFHFAYLLNPTDFNRLRCRLIDALPWQERQHCRMSFLHRNKQG